jgi:hypothetical protein
MNFQNNKVEKSILNYHQSPANHPLNSHSISLMNAALIQAQKKRENSGSKSSRHSGSTIKEPIIIFEFLIDNLITWPPSQKFM